LTLVKTISKETHVIECDLLRESNLLAT